MSNIPTVVVPDRFNAATAFLDHNLVEERGSKTAIYYEGQAYTYAQVAELTNRIGNGLLNLGLDLEQRVALLMLDSPQLAAAFFGAIKIGAVPIPLNTSLRPNDYIYMLNDSRARILLVHAALWKQLAHILPELKYLRHVVVVGLDESGEQERTALHDFEKWSQKASPTLEAASTSKDDSALWLYSSGSTGFPKGCVHLQHDMTFCIEYYAKPILGINEHDITFSAAKLYFAYGLGNGLYFPFGVGASTVLYPGRPLAEDMFKVVQRYRPTIFFGVPTLYASMLALPDAEKRFDFSSVRVCVSAG
ncbi:MAG TPA: AMP-binding protein, partial [Ktedonobacteraceae bacterium]|nr:AMP-binding protein [Ktedonobacteraceae bacterium]